MEQQHAIGKLLLEVQLPSREEAFALQGTLSTRCTAELEPMLSALLDSWSDPDTLLQIDKLEIDLGTCDMEALRRELPEMVITYLRRHFQGMQAQLTLEAGMQRVSLSQGYFESWLYFLEHGSLPAAAVRWQQDEWEAGTLTALSSETYALQQCRRLFTEHPYAVRRLVLQFSPAFVQNWILAYSADTYRQALQLVSEWECFIYHPDLSGAVAVATPTLQQLVRPVRGRAAYHDDSMIWLIREIIVPGRSINNTELLEILIQRMGGITSDKALPRFLYALQALHIGEVKVPVLLQQTGEALSERYFSEISALRGELHKRGPVAEGREEDTGDRDNPEKKDPDEQQRASERKIHEQEHREQPVRREQPETDEEKDDADREKKERHRSGGEDGMKKDRPSAMDEGDAGPEPPAAGTVYYINNAGLILLHPYLPYFFDALVLREGKEFKDEETKHRAVQLLGYLAFGEEEIPEYDLVFPKVLCGIHPTEPVKRFIRLTDVEKAEANEMLSTVITHWNALGNTSADGLRGNFLLREGKLEWKEEEWQLYVTQQAYDMLLNRLPWGFSVVGLSWMPWLIKTVWT